MKWKDVCAWRYACALPSWKAGLVFRHNHVPLKQRHCCDSGLSSDSNWSLSSFLRARVEVLWKTGAKIFIFYRSTCNTLNLADFLMVTGSSSLTVYEYLLSGSCFGVNAVRTNTCWAPCRNWGWFLRAIPSNALPADSLWLHLWGGFGFVTLSELFFSRALKYLPYCQYGNELGNLWWWTSCLFSTLSMFFCDKEGWPRIFSSRGHDPKSPRYST